MGMEIEVWLDKTEADPEEYQVITKRFQGWYADGAEVRYDKSCYGSLTELEEGSRYRVDLGQVEPLGAIRDLHARLHRFGVKVFIHFLY